MTAVAAIAGPLEAGTRVAIELPQAGARARAGGRVRRQDVDARAAGRAAPGEPGRRVRHRPDHVPVVGHVQVALPRLFPANERKARSSFSTPDVHSASPRPESGCRCTGRTSARSARQCWGASPSHRRGPLARWPEARSRQTTKGGRRHRGDHGFFRPLSLRFPGSLLWAVS